jgi:hypothetical protein
MFHGRLIGSFMPLAIEGEKAFHVAAQLIHFVSLFELTLLANFYPRFDAANRSLTHLSR